MEVGLAGVVAPGDEGFGRAVLEQGFNLRAEGVKFALARAFGPSHRQARSFAVSQGFFGAGADEIALYLRRDAKRHRHDFALQAAVQRPVALDRVDMNPFLRGDAENLHTFQHRAAKPGQFRHDKAVAFVKGFQHFSQPALFPRDFAGDFLFDKIHLSQSVLMGKVQDVRLVLLTILVGGADAQISQGFMCPDRGRRGWGAFGGGSGFWGGHKPACSVK